MTTVREIQAELRRRLDAAGERDLGSALRTSVMTHVAWVPAPWREAAEATLAGLGERHPSRTILLFPEPDSQADDLEAQVDLRSFVRSKGGQVCSEVVTIRLLGEKAAVPGSVVMPLLRSDLPVFLRWRGPLPFGASELEQLVAIADRLIVDSGEWPAPEQGYAKLAELFATLAVSDIAWARLAPWRTAVAACWPRVAHARRLSVRGPRAEGLLLRAWLATRLGRPVELEAESDAEVELVAVDGQEVRPDRLERRVPSELLSDELEVFGRDPIYEEAIWSFASHPTSSRSPQAT